MASLGLIPSVAQAAATSSVAIPGTQPSWATSSTAVGAGEVPAATGQISLKVYLASPDPSGLATAAQAVSTPGGSQYGKYLTAAQVQSKYGPTAGEATSVSSWLKRNGFALTGEATGFGAYVAVTGTLADASQAFGVTFGTYTDPEGKSARAPQQAATAPASIAADISAISGLDTGDHDMTPNETTGDTPAENAAQPTASSGAPVPHPHNTLPPPGPNYFIAGPLSTYYGSNIAYNEPTADGQAWPWNVQGYTPQQLRGAYSVTGSGVNGAGQTVAIVDAYSSPTMPADANQFSKTTGNAPFAAGQYTQHVPASYSYPGPYECDAQGWYGEETLDIESVHAMAPGANVAFVPGASCLDTDLLAATAKIVNKHLATIVSNSFGEPADDEAVTNAYEQVYEAGTLQGIGFFVSSGDSGYEDPAVEDPASDKIQVDFPTSSPWVTSVGGTSLAIGQQNNYEYETSWGTLLNPLSPNGKFWTQPFPATYGDSKSNWLYDGSSGGGVSTEFEQPWYQKGVVSNSLATAVPEGSTTTPMRTVPDVSALADPSTGILVGQTTLQPDGSYQFALSRIGGTSVASPVFAGVEADAQQAYNGDIGFANPAIYARAGTSAFHDVNDSPLGHALYEVRDNYTDAYTKTGPLVTYLRVLGIDGQGAAALPATPGYDDSTGVGSPDNYIDSFKGTGPQ